MGDAVASFKRSGKSTGLAGVTRGSLIPQPSPIEWSAQSFNIGGYSYIIPARCPGIRERSSPEVGLHQCLSERKTRGEPVRRQHVPFHVPMPAQTAAKARRPSLSALECPTETDSPLEEAGFEPSVPRQGTAFFTEGNELYPLPINHQAGDRASGEKRLSRGRKTRCQRLRSLH